MRANNMKTCISFRFILSMSTLLLVQCKSLESRTSRAPIQSRDSGEVASPSSITSHRGAKEAPKSFAASSTSDSKVNASPMRNPSKGVAREEPKTGNVPTRDLAKPAAPSTQHEVTRNDSAPKTYQCPKSLSPNQVNCGAFPEGCVYVPGSITHRPLIYFRGLIQDGPSSPPSSTAFLFSPDGSYHLNDAADSNGQMIFATHSHTTQLSEKTLNCLMEINHVGSVDVASHSAGYQGLNSSAGVLSGKVEHLFLLDNFYNTDSVLASFSKIRPHTCSGFFTNHKTKSGQSIVSNASSVRSRTSCDLRQLVGHVSNVAPVLKSRSSNGNIVDSNSAKGENHAISTYGLSDTNSYRGTCYKNPCFI